MPNAKLSLYADPLGDVHTEWLIPVELLQGKPLTVGLPGYKYEMSVFSGIPVPFASIAEAVECEVFKVALVAENKEDALPFETKRSFHGGKWIEVVVHADGAGASLLVQFTVKQLVTRDKVFFNFVYSVASPVAGSITADIDITAHFSYDINSHRFRAAAIDNATGRIDKNMKLLQHWRKGDYIYAQGQGLTIRDDGSLDIHVHGSRLPFKMDRRVFWIVVYILALLGVSGVISLVKMI